MHSLETMDYLNEMACIPRLEHPKLHQLAYIVQRLVGIGGFYRAALMSSIDRYAEHIIARSEVGMSNFEALQQVTLGDIYEASIMAIFQSREN